MLSSPFLVSDTEEKERDLDTRLLRFSYFPKRLAHSREETRDNCSPAEITIKVDTAANAVFRLIIEEEK
jgi:hypothetical protein